MATEREYLVSLGLAKDGARGRFSLEAKEALAKARAAGGTFDEPAYKTAPAKPKPVSTVERAVTVNIPKGRRWFSRKPQHA